jgi:hypothetical protein
MEQIFRLQIKGALQTVLGDKINGKRLQNVHPIQVNNKP